MFLVGFLLIAASVTLAVSMDGKEECPQSDFRSYTHCIRKRDVSRWCTAEGCRVCAAENCPLSCKGFSCGNCPNGDCCDGTKCNACGPNFCCTIASCNYCIRACRHACSNNEVCQNNCIPQCQTVKHDVFIIPSQVPGKSEVVVYIDGEPYKGNITSGKLPTTNKTAVVTIDGEDYPATILMTFSLSPVDPCQNSCNVTSCVGVSPGSPVQNCNTTCNKECEGQTPSQNFSNCQPNCCHVVHPQRCYNNHIYPYRHCPVRSHYECSNLCNSRHVHITHQPQQQHQCHYIKNYPYIYCGQHSLQNCDSCYNCNGRQNPNFCARQNSCSSTCRQNLLPDMSRVYARSVWPGFQQTAELHKFAGYPQSHVYQPMLGGYQQHPNMQYGRPPQYG